MIKTLLMERGTVPRIYSRGCSEDCHCMAEVPMEESTREIGTQGEGHTVIKEEAEDTHL